MSESELPSKDASEVMDARAALSGDVPVIYANGFAVGVTNADVAIVLSLVNRPIQRLHMSYTLAKTLHTKLAGVIADFEKETGRKMLTTDDVDAAVLRKRIGGSPGAKAKKKK